MLLWGSQTSNNQQNRSKASLSRYDKDNVQVSTAALEVNMSLVTLEMPAFKEAAISSYGIQRTVNMKLGNRFGHIKIPLESMLKPTYCQLDATT